MERVAAVVVLLLGSLIMAATALGLAFDIRDNEAMTPLPRLLVAALAGYGMYRASRKLRATHVS